MRFHKHLFGLTVSRIVANAVHKYGLKEFAFLVLEIIPQESNQLDNNVVVREDFYLQSLKPNYNIAPLASNTTGCTHSAESIAKMRKNYSEE